MESERDRLSSQDSLEDLPEIPHAPLHPSQIESHNNTPIQTPAHIVVEEGEVVDSEDKEFTGVSPISEYELSKKLGEGTFGALKKILTHNDKEGFPVTSLREIKLLKSIEHENVIDLMEIAIEKGDPRRNLHATIFMVFPYMDHDLAGLLGNPQVTLSPSQIKSYTQQIFRGIKHLHDSDIIHRDMKDNAGRVKLADFGLARSINHTMTTVIYADIDCCHALRCIFGELLKRRPILPGANEMDQLKKIFELLGSPTAQSWPGYTELPLVKEGKVADFVVKESTLSTRFNIMQMKLTTCYIIYCDWILQGGCPLEKPLITITSTLLHTLRNQEPESTDKLTFSFQEFPNSHELDVRHIQKADLHPHCDIKKNIGRGNYRRNDNDRDRDRNERNGYRRDDERSRRDNDDRRDSRRDYDRNDHSSRRNDEKRTDDRSKEDDRDKNARNDRSRGEDRDRSDRNRNSDRAGDRGYDRDRRRDDDSRNTRRDNDDRRGDRYSSDRRRSPTKSRDHSADRKRRSPNRKGTSEKDSSVHETVHPINESSQQSNILKSESNGSRRNSDDHGRRRESSEIRSEERDDVDRREVDSSQNRKRKSPDRDDESRKRRESFRHRRSGSFKSSPRRNSKEDAAK
ncbi:serine/threonine protein kinase, CMGC, CDC2/CDK sub [Terramyces sp. JEL0728]|nr:serine/threonine protein kinase, CMGC, CDC2/CDK sub [Terramyces sp. JEL0728]